MLDAVITWSLSHRLAVLGGAAIVGLVGGFAASRLVIDAVPDTTPIQVAIRTAAPGLVAEEVERRITVPLELGMGGLPGLESIRSASLFGQSVVVVTFHDGIDRARARRLVDERSAGVELPAGVPRPQPGPASTAVGEVFHYLLVPDGSGLAAAKAVQERVIGPALRGCPGVAAIDAWGGLDTQCQVRVDPDLLGKHALTFGEVAEAVRRTSSAVGGGVVEQAGDSLLVYGVVRTTSVKEIERIVITSHDRGSVRIRDLAEVVIGHENRRGLVTANGQGEVVLGSGVAHPGTDRYAVTTGLRSRLDAIRGGLPPGIRAEVVYERTRLIDRVIATVRQNLIEGGLLVIIVLLAMLGSLRAGIVAATAGGLAMLCGCAGMWQAGIAASLLSLGGTDLGIVVTPCVVVIESILARTARSPALAGGPRLALVAEATRAAMASAWFGQLIVIAAWIPLLALEGVGGRMFRPMAVTAIFIQLGALALSITVVPVLSSLVLPRGIVGHDPAVVRLLGGAYRLLLRGCLACRPVVMVAAVMVLGGTLAEVPRLGTDFVPRLSEGDLVIGVLRAAGTSLEESARLNTLLERQLRAAFPDEIESIWSTSGTRRGKTDAAAAGATDIFLALHPRSAWTKAGTQAELVEAIHREIRGIPGQRVRFTQPIERRTDEIVPGVPADIAVKVFGEDLAEIARAAEEIAGAIRGVPGAADVTVAPAAGQPLIRMAVRPDDIARFEIPARDVLEIIEGMGGRLVGEIVEEPLRFPVVVRIHDPLHGDPDRLGRIPVRRPNGEIVPLARICDIETIPEPVVITREGSERRAVVLCNVRGRDLGGFVAAARRAVAELGALPQGRFRIEWGGEFASLQQVRKSLALAVPPLLVLIVALVHLALRRPADTLLVCGSVPFACVGGVWALSLREMSISIPAAVGFITLSGVSVFNALVLARVLRQRLPGDAGREVAIEEAAATVLRTVVTTALITILGFVPLATSEGTGAEMLRPLATVVIGGVITSTIFTLFILPALHRPIPAARQAPPAG